MAAPPSTSTGAWSASSRCGWASRRYVSLAIPTEKFLAVKDELVAAGRVVSRRPRAWIGLYTAAQPGRVVVDGFNESGPARAAGFRRGDQIVRVNGVDVASQEEFYEQLWRRQAGDLIEVAVRRDDQRAGHQRALHRSPSSLPAAPLIHSTS